MAMERSEVNNENNRDRIYLALGDSMSIDYYTGIDGGGAVSQFFKLLGQGWGLIDKTFDGCTIRMVPVDGEADLVTLTIAGNDAISLLEYPSRLVVKDVISEHAKLLIRIRERNPASSFIVGNIYHPDAPLTPCQHDLLKELNAGIAENIEKCKACLADIYTAFMGHEKEFLCNMIEPAYGGAKMICELFKEQYYKFLAQGKSLP
jgi:lysophospholipase L1-like esterase